MAKRLNFTKEQIDQIKEMYLNNIGSTTIGKSFNCSWSSITKIINKLGIKQSPSIALDSKDEICKKYINGKSIKSLQEEYHSNHQTISKILKKITSQFIIYVQLQNLKARYVKNIKMAELLGVYLENIE